MAEKNKLSYFELKLRELLNTSFPERAADTTFITQRSRRAANAYEGAFMAGNKIEQCNEIANYILFEGLHFSKFDTVFKIVCNEFYTLMADEELRPFALNMLPVCNPVFEQFVSYYEFIEFPSLLEKMCTAFFKISSSSSFSFKAFFNFFISKCS